MSHTSPKLLLLVSDEGASLSLQHTPSKACVVSSNLPVVAYSSFTPYFFSHIHAHPPALAFGVQDCLICFTSYIVTAFSI